MYQIQLDVPINPIEAKERKIDSRFSRLIARSNGVADDIARLLLSYTRQGYELFAIPIVWYSSPAHYDKILESEGVAHWFDSTIWDTRSKSKALIINCKTEEECRFVLARIDSESMLFFFSVEDRLSTNSIRKLCDSSLDGYVEQAFLSQIDAMGVMMFFARSHKSIEVFGLQEEILEVFNKFLEVANTY